MNRREYTYFCVFFPLFPSHVVLLTPHPHVEPGASHSFEVFRLAILCLLAASTDWATATVSARRPLQVHHAGHFSLIPSRTNFLFRRLRFTLDMQCTWFPPWMVVIIIGRRFTVLGLRNIASAEGVTLESLGPSQD